jgi:Zn-finger nucleic acid-binding protein
MNRSQFAPGAGLILDTCRDHGVWMDGGEWLRIATYLRQGGMKRAGVQPGPYLTQHFGKRDSKAWGALAREVARTEGTGAPALPAGAWAPMPHSLSSHSTGWLLMEVLTLALEVLSDD